MGCSLKLGPSAPVPGPFATVYIWPVSHLLGHLPPLEPGQDCGPGLVPVLLPSDFLPAHRCPGSSVPRCRSSQPPPMCRAPGASVSLLSIPGRQIQKAWARPLQGSARAGISPGLLSQLPLLSKPREVCAPACVCCSHFSHGCICPHLHKKCHTPILMSSPIWQCRPPLWARLH